MWVNNPQNIASPILFHSLFLSIEIHLPNSYYKIHLKKIAMKITRKTTKNPDQISLTPDEINDLINSLTLIVNKFPTLYNYKGLTRLNECLTSLSHPTGNN